MRFSLLTYAATLSLIGGILLFAYVAITPGTQAAPALLGGAAVAGAVRFLVTAAVIKATGGAPRKDDLR
jgi:hypothetical protein